MSIFKQDKTLLIVGGAGYIGSHMVDLLQQVGYQVIVLDNLCSGDSAALSEVKLIEGDLGDPVLLDEVFSTYSIGAVMHFAAHIEVGESVVDPAKYYQNNVAKTLNLLDAMRHYDVPYFIFSSTAAIFGEPEYVPIDLAHPKRPLNPYGRSKWMIENILADYDQAYGLKYACLRYFNACGADPQGRMGESHDPETHLIPLILQAASGRRPHISIFGEDYDTPDGTCVRDYVHVCDLAQAHLLALDQLLAGGSSAAYNLGNGEGFSVKQVIDAVKKVTGKAFKVVVDQRRSGDPAILVADSAATQEQLGWLPHYPDLETIIEHAWQWEQSRC